MDSAQPVSFSIEFFPPRSEAGEAKLDIAHKRLAALKPDYFSVTYGAGGSTKEGTRNIVLKYIKAGSCVAPHLSFGGASDDEVHNLLRSYRDAGVNRLVLLRGDVPSGGGSSVHYRYASELVEYVKKHFGDQFHIEVACYPEVHPDSTSYASDVAHFKRKVEIGADSAITQYFYNSDAYFRFVDYCQQQGIHIPIVPGVMPITNYEKLARFSSKCGAEIPQWLRRRLEAFEDDSESLRSFGIDVVSELCERLLRGGAPGIHFYSMNLSKNIIEIWNNLSLSDRR